MSNYFHIFETNRTINLSPPAAVAEFNLLKKTWTYSESLPTEIHYAERDVKKFRNEEVNGLSFYIRKLKSFQSGHLL